MKRIMLILMSFAAIVQLSARDVIRLDRDWRFFNLRDGSSDKAQSVNLPHTWNADALSGRDDYFRGVCNYMKDVTIPAEWSGKQIYLRFSGVGTVTDLIVNGRYVGEHQGGYSAFTFNVTQYLKFGAPNTLWVMVNNAPRTDVLPVAGDFNVYGGIYRDVELIAVNPAHIAVGHYGASGVYVHQKNVLPQRAELETTVNVEAPAATAVTVGVTVLSQTGDTVLRKNVDYKVPDAGQGSLTVPFDMENPTLWNGVKNPYLYRVVVKLVSEGTVTDEVSVPMGLRFFSVDPKQGFLLNGEPYRLKGVVYYEDRAGAGMALQPYQIDEDLDMIGQMGANAVRAAAYPHNERFYDECDRRGLIVWSEIPFVGPAFMTDRGYVNAEAFRNNGIMQLREMIFQQFNHPSIVMWGIFSNQNTKGDDPTDYIKQLTKLAMEEDPSRLTVASSNSDGNINFSTDLIVWDHTFGWKAGLPSDLKVWIEQLQKNWGSLCSGISYGAGASILQQDDSLSRPDYLSRWHPERWQTSLHEQYFAMVNPASYFWGWFVSNMFDYGAAYRNWGDGTGVDDRGLVTFDRKYRKDAFYFYKANWNAAEPMVWIAEKRWQQRPKPEQTIRVYSNAAEVELFVNGASQGKKAGANGTFVWEKVPMHRGVNNVEARSDVASDRTDVSIR